MEFEDVSEQIEWEARRVAAAFGVEEWERSQFDAEIDGKPCQGWKLIGIERGQFLVEVFLYNTEVLFLGGVLAPSGSPFRTRGFVVVPRVRAVGSRGWNVDVWCCSPLAKPR